MGGGPDLSEAAEDGEAMGLTPEQVAALENADPPGFEVWSVNMPVIDTWLTIATQWNAISLADGRVHWVGLDYAAVRAGLEIGDTPIDAKIWAGIRLMERSAAAALNGGKG